VGRNRGRGGCGGGSEGNASKFPLLRLGPPLVKKDGDPAVARTDAHNGEDSDHHDAPIPAENSGVAVAVSVSSGVSGDSRGGGGHLTFHLPQRLTLEEGDLFDDPIRVGGCGWDARGDRRDRFAVRRLRGLLCWRRRRRRRVVVIFIISGGGGPFNLLDAP